MTPSVARFMRGLYRACPRVGLGSLHLKVPCEHRSNRRDRLRSRSRVALKRHAAPTHARILPGERLPRHEVDKGSARSLFEAAVLSGLRRYNHTTDRLGKRVVEPRELHELDVSSSFLQAFRVRSARGRNFVGAAMKDPDRMVQRIEFVDERRHAVRVEHEMRSELGARGSVQPLETPQDGVESRRRASRGAQDAYALRIDAGVLC